MKKQNSTIGEVLSAMSVALAISSFAAYSYADDSKDSKSTTLKASTTLTVQQKAVQQNSALQSSVAKPKPITPQQKAGAVETPDSKSSKISTTLPGMGTLPDTGKSSTKSGLADKSADGLKAAGQLDRIQTPVLGASDSGKANFNQGFDGRPETIDQKSVDAATAGARPDGYKSLIGGGGSQVGEKDSNSSGGIASQGKGAISRDGNPLGSTTGRQVNADGELVGAGPNRDAAKNTRDILDRIANAVGGNGGDTGNAVNSHLQDLDRCANDPDNCGGGAAPAGGEAAKPAADPNLPTDEPTHTSSDGRNKVWVYQNQKTGEVTKKVVAKDDKVVGTINADGTTDIPDADDSSDNAGTPLDDALPRPTAADVAKRLADRNFQIKQSAKVGGATNPDRNDDSTTSGPRVGTVTSGTQQKLNMVGNPVGTGSVNVVSGGKGLDFNNKNLGAIDLGPDTVHTTEGGRQQDRVGDSLGRVQTTADLNTPSDDEDDEDDSNSAAK